MEEARSRDYPVVVADAGDFTAPPTDTLQSALARLMAQALERIHFDAIGLGELDVTLEPEVFQEVAGRLPLVTSNIRFNGSLPVDIPPVRYLDVEGGRVAVTSYLDPLLFYSLPGVFEDPGPVSRVEDPVEALMPLLEEARSRADLIVLLAHAERDEIAEVLARIPSVDVVVQGHDPHGDGALRHLQGTALVVPWVRSRAISLLSVTRTGEASLVEDGFDLWFLQTLKQGDPGLEAMVHDFQVAHGLIK